MSRNAGIETRKAENGLSSKTGLSLPTSSWRCHWLISGFSDMKDFSRKLQIIMISLLRSELYFDDFIFVHRKGARKEVELTKVGVLGLTLTDNGNGYVFIKGIQKRSLVINAKNPTNKLHEITLGKKNPNELAAAVDSCELEYFGFTDDFLIELWGIVSDAKEGRLVCCWCRTGQCKLSEAECK
ncbi:PDZ domain-containing protein GIPC1 [Orchesella cincta]|uniref:PDZ domain-containing protein GIPC1 n=1 Tax=Orchesella cincta TaxID=48709 RepID=A0A1D2M238_ORCCI|nr:PDZ domain-containing protein GIPC1 [Orchesella cincta]